MHWIVLAGAYVILWFLTLQILLPIGIRTPHESGEPALGVADPGAPHQPRLGLKIALATVLAAIVWAIFYALVIMKIVDV